jgi:PAS domain S-box-containing protein
LEPEERRLSDRERTVLLLAAEGLTDKEIAKHLNLSQRTIGTYWERMRLKLGHYSRTQLVARFLRVEADAEDGANYRNLFATWEEGVWILGPDGTTIYANHRIATLFGFTSEDFRDADARTLFAAATSTTVDEVLAAAQKGIQTLDFRLQRPDGSAVWLRLSGSAVTDPRGRCSAVVLLVSDTTVQRRVKHTLDSCESTIAFLSEHSSDLIARFDAELRCVALNPTLLKRLARPSEEIVGRRIEELGDVFRPLNTWASILRDSLSTGNRHSFDSETIEGCPMRTHILPEPSPDFQPAGIFSISTPVD